MREYRFQAGDENIDVFRRLRGAWRDVQATEQAVVVRLADGSAVRLEVDRHDIEPGFAAVCLVGDPLTGPDAHADLPDAVVTATSDLGLGGNDVVLFTGATWLVTTAVESRDAAVDTRGMEAIVQQAGTPVDVPPEAEAMCLTHDALVIASPVGTGCLVRIASIAGRLEVITDRAVIAAFLTMRSYDSGEETPEPSGQQAAEGGGAEGGGAERDGDDTLAR
jgi:hypothetical protein